MRCPTCGTENAPDSRFCGGCGARIEPSRVAPTFKITDDAAYPAPQPALPTPPPGSLQSIGHLPTPQPGSLQMPPQPRLGSIPPTNPAQAIPGRVASVPPGSGPASIPPRVASVPPVERPASSPPGARAATAPAAEPSMSMPAAPRKSSALVAVVVIADLGLAAAGGALLFKGLQKPKAAGKPAQKSEVAPPAPAAAAAADLTAPAPPPAPEISPPKPAEKTVAKEAAKKAPVTKAKPGAAPVDPYAPDLSTEIDRQYAQSVGSFRNCLAQAVQTQPIHGDVKIAFTVEPDGRVTHARVASDTTESPQLSSCLAATIATWTFQPHSGPAASFERPFNYP